MAGPREPPALCYSLRHKPSFTSALVPLRSGRLPICCSKLRSFYYQGKQVQTDVTVDPAFACFRGYYKTHQAGDIKKGVLEIQKHSIGSSQGPLGCVITGGWRHGRNMLEETAMGLVLLQQPTLIRSSPARASLSHNHTTQSPTLKGAALTH